MADSDELSGKHDQTEFKKPVLFGRIGKLPKKVKTDTEKNSAVISQEETSEVTSDSEHKSSLSPAVLLKELSSPIPYKEPKWSGICPDGSEYGLEVLKSGMIVQNVDLTQKPFYVFGRLANCDVIMAHPTISRHHAVIQYKAFSGDGETASGWYIYDLGSTHGTFLNRERIKDHHYTRIRVGHQIKFGTSTRTYIVLGPDFDCEGESELSVTEIKRRAHNMKIERERMMCEAKEQREKEKLEEERKRQELGIDWGMGEDAEEEADLAENPYASTANEELYLEDPKKTLRGYYEREGHELVYDCEERGVGQFICRVELPMDDARGNPVRAEVIHRGKKKEAVVACALEACRILDRAGLLRQAKHESRRRKQRDWSADDYYDSDEDTFLDRTGSVEKKRRARMQKHGVVEQESSKPLTYDDLIKQIQEIETNIESEEKVLERLRAGPPRPATEGPPRPVTEGPPRAAAEDAPEDALDEFMSCLAPRGQSMADKADISRTKMGIQKLKSQLAKTRRLAELARPAAAPPLLKKDENKMAVKQTNSIVYGKRIRLKEDIEKRPKVKLNKKQEDEDFVEEVDSDEEQQIALKEEKEEKDDEVPSRTQDNGIEKTEKEEKGNTVAKDKETPTKVEVKTEKRIFGPMRPPEDYVIPENYFDQETDRDLPEIEETGSNFTLH